MLKTTFSKYFYLFFLLIALSPSSGYAQYQTAAKPKLDMTVHITEEEFYSQTTLVEEVPFGDQSLSYKVRLPGNWVRTDDSALNVEVNGANNKLLGEVVEYISPPKLDLRSRFSIKALRLESITTAENWFLNYILTNGYVMEGFEVVSDERIEAQYVRVKNGDSYVIRAVARINGPRMILAEYAVPFKYLKQERDIQIYSMITFYLTDPDERPIEEKIKYQFLDIAEFYYPASWYLQEPEIRRADRVDIKILNSRAYLDKERKKEVLMDGIINIHLVARDLETSLAYEIEQKKEELEKAGLVLGDFIERLDDITYPVESDIGMIDIYQAKNVSEPKLNYELCMGVVRTDSHYWIFYLFSPGRQDDFPVWARNMEAIKSVVPTFRVLNPHIVSY